LATFRLRHFSSPSILRSIDPDRLLALLGPHQEFFESRGLTLPAAGYAGDLEYEALVDIFSTPDSGTPKELLDALFLIDEMSTAEGMDSLLTAAESAGIDLNLPVDENHSPADVAVQVWLLDREILERKHAEQFLQRPKSFEYFQSHYADPPVFTMPVPAVRQQLENALDNWFELKRRGRGTRVFIYEDSQEVRFLIRHGEPFKREESLNGAGVASVCYRPLKYDVVVFDRQVGELRINAQLVGEKKLYCEKLGRYLFSDGSCFPGTKKYTLEPLRELGVDALACGDIEGIELITLTEVDFHWGGGHGEVEVRKADDLFAALAAREGHLPTSPRIIKAVFRVKFEDSKTPRTVKIRPGNIAEYTRDGDASLIEQWLNLRGFILPQETIEHAAATEVLASH
jgi:hypothetical protein